MVSRIREIVVVPCLRLRTGDDASRRILSQDKATILLFGYKP